MLSVFQTSRLLLKTDLSFLSFNRCYNNMFNVSIPLDKKKWSKHEELAEFTVFSD